MLCKVTLTHIWLGWSLTSCIARIPKLPTHIDLCRPCPFSVVCEHSRPRRRVTSMYHPRLYFSYSERSRFVEFGWQGYHQKHHVQVQQYYCDSIYILCIAWWRIAKTIWNVAHNFVNFTMVVHYLVNKLFYLQSAPCAIAHLGRRRGLGMIARTQSQVACTSLTSNCRRYIRIPESYLLESMSATCVWFVSRKPMLRLWKVNLTSSTSWCPECAGPALQAFCSISCG